MDYISRVEVLQATQGLSERPFQGILRVELFPTTHSLDDRSYSSIHELNKNPKNAPVIIVSIDHVQAKAIFTATHAHQSDFIVHELAILVVPRRAKLQRELLLVFLALHAEDLREATHAEFVLAVHVVKRRRIDLLPDVVLRHLLLELLRCWHLLLLFELQRGGTHY